MSSLLHTALACAIPWYALPGKSAIRERFTDTAKQIGRGPLGLAGEGVEEAVFARRLNENLPATVLGSDE